MLSCPRCGGPIPPGVTRCPGCGYDVSDAGPDAPPAAWDRDAEGSPGSLFTRGGGVTAATPPDETPGIAPVTDDEASSLIPGLTETPPQFSGPSEQEQRYWVQVGAAVVAALAVLAVIAVLAVSRTGHRGGAHAPAIAVALTPTSSTRPSGAAPSSASGSGARSGSTKPPSHERAVAQASTIAGYLASSRRVRPGVGDALSAISSCTNIASAVAILHHAADVRTDIFTALASADVSALPDGAAAALADLRRAMQSSADADRHYAAWGRTVAGCHRRAPHNAEFAAARRSGTVADAARQRFADEWNPIAVRYGLAEQNANTI